MHYILFLHHNRVIMPYIDIIAICFITIIFIKSNIRLLLIKREITK